MREEPKAPQIEFIDKEVPRTLRERVVYDWHRKTKVIRVPDQKAFEAAMEAWKYDHAKWLIERFEVEVEGRWTAGTCGPEFKGPQ